MKILKNNFQVKKCKNQVEIYKPYEKQLMPFKHELFYSLTTILYLALISLPFFL